MDNDSSIIKLGPVGDSKYGTTFDHKGSNDVVQIFISHGDRIESIQFQYAKNGSLLLSQRIGSNHIIKKFNAVKLNYPVEYITSISGYKSRNTNNLCSIKFGTNCGEYGPFGLFDRNDEEFSFSLGDRQFGGFYGTASGYALNSIGVYLKPIATLESSFDKSVVIKNEKGVRVSIQ